MIQYLPSRFVVKEHKPMICGRLCMNCSLKHLLSMHIVLSIDTLSLTLPAADWKQRRCCLQAPADLCDDWLFYRMCCWVNAGMDCMCLMTIAKTPGRISHSVHLSTWECCRVAWECCSTLQHSHTLKWTDPGLFFCSDCLVHCSPLLAAEHLILVAGSRVELHACYRRLRLHDRLWRPSTLESRRSCSWNHIQTFGWSDMLFLHSV